jgi:serine/threonine-protein kinase
MSSETPVQNDRVAQVGRYQIVKRIGAGGMGTVYKAIDVNLGREVALKILPEEMSGKADMIKRFQQEARHAARLLHEHIVTLYEFDKANGVHYLAMQYVEGCNLHEYIEKKGKLDPEEARRFTIQAARALAQAHKHNIVHRDIKPSNFLLTEKDGQPFIKLTDFGLARTVDDDDFGVTKTGTTVGTVDYISPEQARNSRSADIRSDIYSLGCSLYHMLSGKPPFPEGDMTERLLKHLEAEPPDLTLANPKVPPGLALVVKKMMAKKPADRYQTPAELIKDLEHLPSGPAPDGRQALDILAKAGGDSRPDKPRAAKPTAETRKHAAVDPTKPMTTPASPAASSQKLRYRGKMSPKKKRLAQPGQAGFQLPVVISGWKAWVLTVSLTAAAVSLLVVLGNSTPPPAKSDTDDEVEVDDQAKGPGIVNKKEVDASARDNMKDFIQQAQDRRAGSDPVQDRAAAQRISQQQGARQIYKASPEMIATMMKQFPQVKEQQGVDVPQPGVPQEGAVMPREQGNAGQAAQDDRIPRPTAPTGVPDTQPSALQQGQRPQTGQTGDPNQPPFDRVQPKPGNTGTPLPPPQNQNPLPRPDGTQQRPDATQTPIDRGPKPVAGKAAPPVSLPPSLDSKQTGSAESNPPIDRTQSNRSSPEKAPNQGNQNRTSPGRESRESTPGQGNPKQVAVLDKNRPSSREIGRGGSSRTEPPVGTQGGSSKQPARAPQGGQEDAAAPFLVSVSRNAGSTRGAGSLAAAISKARAGAKSGPIVVEIEDSGPLFETPIAVSGRDLVLRGRSGYRPLIAWDVQAADRARTNYLVSVSGGNLTLENIDFVVQATDSSRVATQGLIQVTNGSLKAEGCTFSISGNIRSHVSAVKMESTKPDGPRQKCELNRCLVRGRDSVALELQAPNTDVMLIACLLVGGNQPLVEMTAAPRFR